jgi:hypothetical protein
MSCKDDPDVAGCTWSCYGNGGEYPAFRQCWDDCSADHSIASAKSAKDKVYIRCANSFSFDIIENDGGFLHLPFNSTDGLSINVVWNYTDDWCSNVSTGAHKAIDFDRPGEPSVHAAAIGTVVHVVNESCVECPKGGYGAYVKVESTDPSTDKTYEIIYAHLKNGSIGLEKGDRVLAGDYLGIMSNTGNSEGIHLHFEVRDNKTKAKIDPYDIYGINECDYPLGDNGNECGPDSLWATCPPALAD